MEQQPLIEIIDGLIAARKVRLPVFNAVAARIQQEVGSENPNLSAVEKLIVSDQALTTEVLRYANSAFFRGLSQIATVREAISRLGINEVHNIVLMLSHQSHFRSRDPQLNSVLIQLWRHALGTALAAHWLARHSGRQALAHEGFIAGLLHDVGKLFVLSVIDDLLNAQTLAVRPSAALFMEAMDQLHTGHGYTLMTHWNLPEKYARIVRDHHAEDLPADNPLALMVRLANKVCAKMGIGLKPEPRLMLVATGEAAELRLSEIDLAKLEIMLEDSPVCANKSGG
jgi:HD-like signal output (HDOD) protein